MKNLCQKVSLPDEWREKYLARLESEQSESRQSSDLFAQNLRDSISAIKIRLERLTDAYLGEALELGEYQEKKTLEEKLSDFERKGNHWFELMRNWIIEVNQAENLSKQENLSGMKDFLVDIGSNRRLAAGMLLAEFKTPWNFLAEMPAQARAFGAGAVNSDANQFWWTHRESNPDLFHAMELFYRYTMGPRGGNCILSGYLFSMHMKIKKITTTERKEVLTEVTELDQKGKDRVLADLIIFAQRAIPILEELTKDSSLPAKEKEGDRRLDYGRATVAQM